ncbi:MAG TPA: DNA repair protein RadA [Cyclobacteriaceae bacterium]
MAKIRSLFFCQQCGYESPKWLGKCPACGSWNTFVEEVVQKHDVGKSDWRTTSGTTQRVAQPKKLNEIGEGGEVRLMTRDQELNRVLGGGIVPGSLILIGGEPGIGKSTLMLQLGTSLSGKKTLYVSGEESEQQIRMRASRMGLDGNEHCYILTETRTRNIFQAIESIQPDLVVIDSIQTLYSDLLDSAAGSIAQVRQCAGELLRFAKESETPVVLIGHITKDGLLAGPKVLEHMVDTVLQFEGDRHLVYRILRTVKNRFGPTSEMGIYEMLGNGLRQVSNPSEILISQKDPSLSGITIGATIEGNRPLLIEVQSLVSPAAYGTPQRTTTGFDPKRLNMLLAVLEKRCGFPMGRYDVFVNMAGGIKVEDPAIDLALCVSLVSSLQEIPVSDKVAFAAEVGLGGELRAVHHADQRISEAEKLGFSEIHISRHNKKSVDLEKPGIKINALGKLQEVIQYVME